MASIGSFAVSEISKDNPKISRIRTTLETLMFQNNITEVHSAAEAYHLAHQSKGTIVTDMPVYAPEKIGLPENAKVLLFNDGNVVGRTAAARVILGVDEADQDEYAAIAREAVYQMRYKNLYHAQAVIGLDKDFMIRAHLIIPENYENILYNWMMNFHEFSEDIKELYKNSKSYPETDIIIVSDPDQQMEGRDNGLALFDPMHNCALLCGLRYFGEHKKGTLTLGWTIANRNGHASCHGGMKRIEKKDGTTKVLGVFGLSGSGKSTLTHATHDGKYNVEILHDDAYIIHEENGHSIALEPSYFDKTADYPAGSEANQYLVSIQNCGATRADDGRILPVTEDIRNGNGRAIKSVLWTTNRINRIDESVDAICWIMKEEIMPPFVRVNDPVLASVLGATLATKRSSAENLAKGYNMNQLVIEPYANPFRTYPLKNDYVKFKSLFENRDVGGFVLNTGAFMGKDIKKEVTIDLLEQYIEDRVQWKKLFGSDKIEYAVVEGYEVEETESYKKALIDSIKQRIQYLKGVKEMNKLPEEAIEALEALLEEIN